MAQATIIGNLGKDPQFQTSQDGRTDYTRLNVAWSESSKDRTGQWVNGPVVWVFATVFGNQAQNVARSLKKGDRVVLSGDLKAEEWQSDQGPQTTFTMRVNQVGASFIAQQVSVQKQQSGNQQNYQSQNHAQDAWSQAESQGQTAQTGGFSNTQIDPPF